MAYFCCFFAFENCLLRILGIGKYKKAVAYATAFNYLILSSLLSAVLILCFLIISSAKAISLT